MRAIVWLRNELRLKDNPLLKRAQEAADELILFYCFDQQFYKDTNWGFPRTDSFRAQFVIDALADLQANLKEASASLQIRIGDSPDEIKTLAKEFGINTVYCGAECTYEETIQEKELENYGFHLKRVWQSTLYHPEELPFPMSDLPKVFTAFRKKVEKYAAIREPEENCEFISYPANLKDSKLPKLQDLGLEKKAPDSRSVLSFKGGETAAWNRLNSYFWECDHLQTYKETRNGLLGANYSSKFSPWLAIGCISPVSIYQEIKRYEKERKKNSSTYWLYFELMWRDFFRLTALKEGNTFFKIPLTVSLRSTRKFDAWTKGETGQDFVDANLRELRLTGFMSNRGRQNVASYLVHDLGLNWYLGAAWFESQLIDYDVCSNYGNWTYVAGIGNDPRENRWFNVAGQAERYDPEGKYRQVWLEN